MVIALGIDTQGRKHVLGLREGATETAAVTTGLLSDLVTRGLPTDRALLFVVDGAAGLRRAITDVFGSRGVVQRCQVHKCRHVLGHLPERLHASVRLSARRCGMRGSSIRRTARRGCWSGWPGLWNATIPAPQRPSGRGSRRR